MLPYGIGAAEMLARITAKHWTHSKFTVPGKQCLYTLLIITVSSMSVIAHSTCPVAILNSETYHRAVGILQVPNVIQQVENNKVLAMNV